MTGHVPLRSQALRFGAVGLTCVALNLALFGTLVDWLGWNYVAVTCIAFVVVNALGFALNRSWTFVRSGGSIQRQAIRFTVIQCASLLLNIGLMWLLVGLGGVRAAPASLVVSALFALGNFIAQRQWAFRST